MKFHRFIIFFSTFLLFGAWFEVAKSQTVTISPVIQKDNGVEYYLHTVQRGETLYRISKTYQVSVDDIVKMNPSVQSGLKPLQELKIPKKNATDLKPDTSKPGSYIYHIVRQGETPESIGLIYDISNKKLLGFNEGVILPLQKDQILKIPVDYADDQKVENQPPPSRPKFHVVKPKETLFGISRLYGLSIIDLLSANPKAEQKLQVGDTLTIETQEAVNSETHTNSHTVEHDKHIVKKKETWYGISKQYGLSVSELQELNEGITTLSPGLELVINKKSIVKTPEEVPEKITQNNSQADLITIQSQTFDEKPKTKDSTSAVFKVALLIPLDLDKQPDTLVTEDNEAEKILQQQFRFLPFYEGLRIAADSLARLGVKIELTTYDVPKDSDKLSQLLKSSSLKESDIIIGLVYANDFNKLAQFAANHQIPLLNPLTKRRESVKDNPWVVKMQNDETSRLSSIAEYLKTSNKKHDFIISRQNKYQLGAESKDISNMLNSLRTSNPKLVGRVDIIIDSIDRLKTLINKAENPIVFSLAENPAYVMDYLRKLSSGKEISTLDAMFGLPDWDQMEKLETMHLEELNVIMPRAFHARYRHYTLDGFLADYQNRFAQDPVEMSFMGFDALWVAGQAFRSHKGLIEYLKGNSVEGILAKYHFSSVEGQGLENTFWNLYKIENYNIKVVNR